MTASIATAIAQRMVGVRHATRGGLPHAPARRAGVGRLADPPLVERPRQSRAGRGGDQRGQVGQRQVDGGEQSAEDGGDARAERGHGLPAALGMRVEIQPGVRAQGVVQQRRVRARAQRAADGEERLGRPRAGQRRPHQHDRRAQEDARPGAHQAEPAREAVGQRPEREIEGGAQRHAVGLEREDGRQRQPDALAVVHEVHRLEERRGGDGLVPVVPGQQAFGHGARMLARPHAACIAAVKRHRWRVHARSRPLRPLARPPRLARARPRRRRDGLRRVRHPPAAHRVQRRGEPPHGAPLRAHRSDDPQGVRRAAHAAGRDRAPYRRRLAARRPRRGARLHHGGAPPARRHGAERGQPRGTERPPRRGHRRLDAGRLPDARGAADARGHRAAARPGGRRPAAARHARDAGPAGGAGGARLLGGAAG